MTAAMLLAAALPAPHAPVFVARPLPASAIAPKHDSDIDAALAAIMTSLAPIQPTDAESAMLRAALDATLGVVETSFREAPVTLRGVDLSLGVDEHDDGLVLVSLSRRIDGVLQSFATFFVEGQDTFPVDGETADPLLLVA